MVRTLNLTAEISANRELRITLPQDVPEGPAEIVIVVSSPSTPSTSTFRDLAESEFFGMWRDRSDITDSASFAQDLRARGWKRSA